MARGWRRTRFRSRVARNATERTTRVARWASAAASRVATRRRRSRAPRAMEATERRARRRVRTGPTRPTAAHAIRFRRRRRPPCRATRARGRPRISSTSAASPFSTPRAGSPTAALTRHRRGTPLPSAAPTRTATVRAHPRGRLPRRSRAAGVTMRRLRTTRHGCGSRPPRRRPARPVTLLRSAPQALRPRTRRTSTASSTSR